MKKFQFLLLDAGPIFKLFELDIWEKFIKQCDVTIARTVVDQLIKEIDTSDYILYPFEQAATDGFIKIVDINPSEAKQVIYELNQLNYDIHSGEQETIAFFLQSSEDFQICAADKAVFRFLGYIGKGEKGISLEELLNKTGFGEQLEWKFTKKFRDKYTKIGQADKIQNTKLP
jgi:hypothetical protein